MRAAAFRAAPRRLALRSASALLALVLVAPPAPAEIVDAVDLGGLETRSAALVLSAQEGGELRPELATAALAGAASRARVALAVEVSGEALLAGHGEEDLLLEVYVYALADGGSLGGFLTQGARLPLDRHRAALERRGVKFLAELALAPGRYSLRTLVFQRRQERFGLRSAELEVPTAEAAAAPRPLLLEPAGDWVVVRAAAPTDAPPALFPLATAGGPLVPAAGPGAGARLWIAGRDLPPRLPARLFDPDGSPRARLELAGLEPLVAATADGLELAAAELEPGDLPAGEYLLDLGDEAAAAPLPAAVRMRIEPSASASAEPPASGPRSAGGLEAAYLEALRALADGDRPAARAAVRRLEISALRGGDSRRQAGVEAAMTSVASRLTALHAEAAVPLLELHEQLYRDYRRERELFLAAHARRLLSRLAALYEERASSPLVPRVLASVAVSRAAHLLEEDAVPSALAGFDEALDHDPRDPGALAGAAAIREALGDYEATAAALQKLLADVGDSLAGDPLAGEPLAEIRLRLALSLRRLQAPAKAAVLLRAGLDGGAPAWVRAVARQELAALELDRGRLDAARELLEEGLAERPGDPWLSLRLAATLDRAGRPGEAREVLRRIVPADPDVPSPRLRYATWPDWIAAVARRQLEVAAEERLPALAVALERVGEAGR